MRAHRKGQLDVAERLYQALLAEQPEQPDALHYLGVLRHQQGRSDEAVDLIARALAEAPGYADAHNNLGNIHKECERLEAAEACYRTALDCAPKQFSTWSNLATVMEALDRLPEAFQCYVRYLEGAPEEARAYYMMGSFLRDHPQNLEHLEQAVDCFRKALEIDPTAVDALEKLGVSLYALKRREEAQQVYRDWLQREPDNPVPRHMLAACGGSEAPMRADDAYVCAEFDSFAESFDRQLVEHLHYRAPQVLAAALDEVLSEPSATLDMLDAGCGTGLCAPLVRKYARDLTGVDLSSGMLARARQRGGYDRLVEAELTAFLHTHPASYDVVLSADTLVYFGDLDAVLKAARAALRPRGWLAFSLEAAQGDGFLLSPSGRYQHSRDYIHATLQEAGLDQVRISSDSLRREAGEPVASWVVLARHPGDDGQGNREGRAQP